MAYSSQEEEARLAALCSRLGRLWTPKPIEVWDDEAPAAKLEECKLCLIGKILSTSTVNLPAFQHTMNRIWRTDNVEVSQREEGLYVVKFNSEAEKQRVLETGPWLFSNNLVILKPWTPNTPFHCYDFTCSAFWVQVFGLPLERCTPQLVSKAVSEVGKVLEVRIESKDKSPIRVVRAKVELSLSEPLKPGKLLRIAGKNIWLDFRYERLPHYCYSCGIIGHYASYCKDIPYEDTKFDSRDQLYYGQWLRADVREHSPFWQAFYESTTPPETFEETVPETPPSGQLLLPAVPYEIPQQTPPMEARPTQQLHSSPEPMVLFPSHPAPAQQHDYSNSTAEASSSKKTKHSHLRAKPNPIKKAKRFLPYHSRSIPLDTLDESLLLDTPILEAPRAKDWAVVACPTKPPMDK